MKQRNKTVLIASADRDFISKIDENLCLVDYEVRKASSQADILSEVEKTPPDIVFLDFEKLDVGEFDLVNYLKSRSSRTEIIILTTINELEEATYALRHGASFYLMKPVGCEEIKSVIDKISTKSDRSREYTELENRFFSDLMGGNPAMEKVLRLARKIAPTSSTVLIGGESGTGKEFFAKIIHRLSGREDGRFTAMNCGAIPETLFESELFGHRKGAFTGADRDKPGLVEEAHMGTLFLDEVGELTPQAQVKLLRFLQERSFRRVGDTTDRTVNVRIIAATNKDLPTLVEEGTFREDLFYRLNVFYLNLPPLRYRRETIPNLIRLFVHRYNQLLDKDVNRINPAAEAILANYDYPGNVRELENIVEHAVVLSEGNEITERELPEFMLKGRLLLNPPRNRGSAPESPAEIITLQELEKQHIQNALQILDYNYTATAKKLGISRSTLWRKIKELDIEKA